MNPLVGFGPALLFTLIFTGVLDRHGCGIPKEIRLLLYMIIPKVGGSYFLAEPSLASGRFKVTGLLTGACFYRCRQFSGWPIQMQRYADP